MTYGLMIQTAFYLPSPLLRPYVHHYWILQTRDMSTSHTVMPMESLKWIFHRKRPFDVNGQPDLHTKASVCGQYKAAIHIESSEALEVIMIFFQPYAARLVMNAPCTEFANANIDFDLLENPAFSELKRQVLEADTHADCISYIERFLLRQLIRTQDSPYLQPLEHVFRQMTASAGEVRVEALADAACLSERQFRRIFADYVGMTPKQMLCVRRFHQAANALMQQEEASFDSLLCRLGYTDHGHFNREFHRLAGMSPTDFVHHLEDVNRQGCLTAYRSYHCSDE